MTDSTSGSGLARRHLRFGLCALLLFLTGGVVLELMHGFKVSWYLDTHNETRRLLWRLGHAHGTLLALVNIVVAAWAQLAPELAARWSRVASPCLLLATVLLPGGFFLGGAWIYNGDPGLGIFLVPAGAAALLLGVLVMARAALVWEGPGSSGPGAG